MKKVIIGLTGIVLAAFIVVMFTNASTGDPKDTKKATTEMSKDCAKCPSAAKCADKAEVKSEDTKTAEAKPCAAACKTPCTASTEAKKCDAAKPCAAKK
jgi:cytoskeletal protein RodZ